MRLETVCINRRVENGRRERDDSLKIIERKTQRRCTIPKRSRKGDVRSPAPRCSHQGEGEQIRVMERDRPDPRLS